MQFFKLIISAFILFLLTNGTARGQLPTFSGFWRTPQITAPTAMAGNNAYEVTAHYRLQGFEEEMGYRTYMISGQIPLYDRVNTHFGTLGVSLMQDETGTSYHLSTTGILVNYLYDAALSPEHHLVAGVQGGYYGRRLDWSRVRTSNQFGNGAFDPAINHGEQFSEDPSQAFITNVGLAYYLTDFEGNPLFHVGTSLSNANRGSFTYLLNNENQALPMAFVSYAHFRVISTPYYEVVSDLYWRKESMMNDIIGGFQVRKGTRPRVKVADNHLGIGLYYSQDHTGIIALQMVQPHWQIGINYDMVFGNQPLRSMQNAVEVSLGWRAIRTNKTGYSYKKKQKRKLPWKKKNKLPW